MRRSQPVQVDLRRHEFVREFLSSHCIYGMITDRLTSGQRRYLNLFLTAQHMLTRDEILGDNLDRSTVSAAVKNLRQHLHVLSVELGLLPDHCLTIGEQQYGKKPSVYCLACSGGSDEEVQKVLENCRARIEAKRSPDTWARLRQELEREAECALYGLLQADTMNDYIETGIEKQVEQQCENGSPKIAWAPFPISELYAPYENYYLVSNVGMGKSTFMRVLQHRIAREKTRIAVYLEAREVEQLQTACIDIFTYLGRRYERWLGLAVGDVLREEQSNIIFLIDGLDQISNVGGAYIVLVEGLTKQIGQARMILAGRPTPESWVGRHLTATSLRINPFTPANKQQYFGEYLVQAEKLTKSVSELLSVPIFASMVRTLVREGRHSFITNHADLYHQYVDYIYSKHPPNEKLSSDQYREDVHLSLASIAYEALACKEPQVQEIDISFAKQFKVSSSVRIDDLPRFGLVDRIELPSKDGRSTTRLRFIHQSFQEYFAACWINEDKYDTRLGQVLNELWNLKWREVLKFLAGMRGESLIQAIYPSDQPDNVIHSRLFLAASLVPEASCSVDVLRRIMDELRTVTTESTFQEVAVTALFAVDAPTAFNHIWNLFLAHLHKGEEYAAVYKLILIAHEKYILPASHVQLLIDIILQMSEDERTPVLGALRCIALASLPPESLVKLRNGLHDPSIKVRACAVQLMAACRNDLKPEDVKRILDVLCDPQVWPMIYEVPQLMSEHLTEGDCDDLIASFMQSSDSVRKRISWLLGGCTKRFTVSQVRSLAPFVVDVDTTVTSNLQSILRNRWSCVHDILMQILPRWLDDERPDVREAAINAMLIGSQSIDREHALLVMGRMLDPEACVRRMALYSTRWFPVYCETEQIDAAIAMLSDTDPYCYRTAVEISVMIMDVLNSKQRERLLEVLERSDEITRRGVISAYKFYRPWPKAVSEMLIDRLDSVCPIDGSGQPRALLLVAIFALEGLSRTKVNEIWQALLSSRLTEEELSDIARAQVMRQVDDNFISAIVKDIKSQSDARREFAWSVASHKATSLSQNELQCIAQHLTDDRWGYVAKDILENCYHKGMEMPVMNVAHAGGGGIQRIVARMQHFVKALIPRSNPKSR